MLQDKHIAIKVWDWPVRAFHWAIVVLLVVQVVSGQVGGEMMVLHAYSGYCVLVLVVFRILWGFAGSTHARFASFLAGPAATLRFARRLFSREAVPQVGHNPLGGWSVVAMVVVVGLQAVSGLFANDGAGAEGPFAARVPLEVSNALSQFHRWNLQAVLLLSGLHVLAVLFHWLVKKEDLMRAMFTGVKEVPEAAVRERREGLRDRPRRRAASREHASAYFASAWRAIVVLAVAIVLVAGTLRYA